MNEYNEEEFMEKILERLDWTNKQLLDYLKERNTGVEFKYTDLDVDIFVKRVKEWKNE